MESLSSYVLTITGVILVSVVVELVIPDGQINKYIKNVFSFLVIGVIIAPLPGFVSNKNVTSIFEVGQYEIQDEYIYALNCSKLKVMQNEEEAFLSNQGYKQIELIFHTTDMYSSDLNIDKITIDLTDMVIGETAEYKNLNDVKVFLCQRYVERFDIKEDNVIYEV